MYFNAKRRTYDGNKGQGFENLYLTLLLLLVSSSVHALPITSNSRSPLRPPHLDAIIQSPHVGYVSDNSNCREIFVIGTSHFRCNSAKQVTSLIEQVQPDGVVLELDPERVLRLTKQHSSAKFSINGDDSNSQELLYGADFVAAIDACQRLDIPLFLGDEYAQETKERVVQQLFRAAAYSPTPLIRSLVPKTSSDITRRINVWETFANDPQKLTPLIVASSPPFLVPFALAIIDNGQAAFNDMIGGMFQDKLLAIGETALAISLSFLVSCLLFNTVIAERDEILADSTVRASNIVRLLKEKKLVRKRWTFTVDASEDMASVVDMPKSKNADTEECSDNFENEMNEIPLFTLKNALKPGMVRNLNLFEPRWLKMIDRVTNCRSYVEWDTNNPPQFGCVHCTNKFYSAISIDGSEARYADIIFERVGALATMVALEEGRRPVSGDRKVNVAIVGSDYFVVDESKLSITDDGYMVARDMSPMTSFENIENAEVSISNRQNEKLKMIVVVGLLHGNGIVNLLSDKFK
mmetsp:Transcript_28273/g.56430  ORF Transcript_28273/g.56430 Transcript_28273/m.56430 type:complete len:523 (-) Transcript_28273:28-1596(-)